MKKIILFFLLQGFVLSTLQAQNSSFPPLTDSYIVLANGTDTLHKVKISKNKRKTNEHQVTYKGEKGKTIQLQAGAITAYFDGELKYVATTIQKRRQRRSDQPRATQI